MLQEAITAASNELDGKTESQTPKTTLDAKNNIQSFLSPYKSSRFIFFAFRKEGNVVHLLFEVDDVRKLLDNVAILSGNVVFANTQLPGDITIEFKIGNDGNVKSTVYYKFKGKGYKYVLMPDNRTASKWNELVHGLQDSLTAGDERVL